MKTRPTPRFIFDLWAQTVGEGVAAQYMAEDGYISWRRARIIMLLSDILSDFLGLFWWWAEEKKVKP